MKLFKKLAVVLAAVLTTACLSVFAAACTEGDDTVYATDTVTVIVQYEDGTPIDGTKHSSGESWLSDTMFELDIESPAPCTQVQFCVVYENGSLGACAAPVNIDEDGKAVLQLSDLKEFVEANNVTLLELHICNVKSYGYDKGEDNAVYGRYEIDKIPATITVTLKAAQE